MAEGQKGSRIGRGMKPRGNTRVKKEKRVNGMTEHSTVEGQAIPAAEAVLDPKEGNETPGNLEPENGVEKLQNLEDSEATVAHDSDLEAALSESGDVVDAEFEEVDETPVDIETLKEFYESVKFSNPPSGLMVGDLSEDQLKAIRVEANDPGKLIWHPSTSAVGPQPDGSEKFVITVEEQQVEMVKAYAASDGTGGVSVEKWISERFFEFIEAYSGSAQGR